MQSRGCDFVFQHCYGKKWICYSDAEMQVLNRAVKRNQKKVTMPSKDPKRQIVVNFETMLQKNVISNVEQRVRALIYTQKFYAWMWLDDDDEYSSFRPFQVYSLEAAFQQKLTEIKFYNYGDYKVDLKNLRLIDEDCNECKNVIREAANLVPTSGISEIIHQNKTLLFQMCQDDSLKSLCKESRIFDTSSVRKSLNSSKKSELVPLEVLETSNGLVDESKSTQRFSTCVDKECPNAPEYKVYSAGNLCYGATLTYTSVENNVNKYSIIQILLSNKKYFLWQRWGRIGYKAQTDLVKFGSKLNEVIEAFEDKFYEKTKNEWQDVLNFHHVPGKYDLSQMDLSPETIDETSDAESLLPVPIKDLLSLITSRKMMHQIMEEMSLDLQNGIGKLTIVQIKDGYSALNKIAGIISSSGKGKDLINACDEFYTKIPHNFGRNKPPILSTLEDVEEKLKMLETLLNINIALDVFNEAPVPLEHPLDRYYRSLECELRLIDQTTNEFSVIKKCLLETHGLTHKSYELELLNAFSCFKPIEDESYANYENKLLVWHGSRLTNWIGILKEGLQIAPIEAPSTGAMFGKGLYFADSSSKSANYCGATKKQNVGLLLLCEVGLGNSLELFHEVEGMPYFLPPGFDSVTGRGKVKPSSFQLFSGMARLPVGPLVEDKDVHSSLDYNEYVVYSTKQVKMKYLLLVKFNFISS